MPAFARSQLGAAAWLRSSRLVVMISVCAVSAFAHQEVAAVDGGVTEDIVLPVLKSRATPEYPAQALADKREGDVELELIVDDQGSVAEAQLLAAVDGFNDAALDAAKRLTFEPARHHGVPTRVKVRFTVEFRLPRSDAPSATSVVPAAYQTTVFAGRPTSAASSFTVRDRDFALRPIGSVQDILRVTPGLVVMQHAGGGKANQYFLRGFDADHGTDLALSIDGVPINLVSHAHGQGYADTSFIIPEVVEKVEITKGTAFANQGDFATAGAVNLRSRNEFEHSGVALGFGGSPGQGAPSYRALLMASPKFDALTATFAAEVGHADGPFENPENWNKYKLFNKLVAHPSANSELTVTEMSYASEWHGSGQLPQRAVEAGLVSRYGSLDLDEGGVSARHQLSLQYSLRPTEHSELKAMVYAATYRFNLFSNFTLYLQDEDRGDELEQADQRVFYGGQVSYRIANEFMGVRLQTTVGANVRSDDIHQELWHTLHRERLNGVRANDVHETSIGAYLNEEVTPWPWLRVNLGGRADALSYAVDDRLPSADEAAPKSGAGGVYQLSPKASLIVTPLAREDAQLELYVNYGHGFHSNDVRGVFSTPAVTPLTRAIGEELGVRAKFFNRWDVAAALWQLDLANETVWNGDEGTTGVSDPTTRRGIEFETRFEITSWLAADLDVTFTHSQFSKDGTSGEGLALAPKQTWAGGLSARHALGPGLARAGVRFYGLGDRPASEDGQLVAPGFTEFDVHLGYRHRWFDVALDIENLFNAAFRSAQFATVSRLRSEPAIGTTIPTGFSCGSKGRVVTTVSGRFGGCEDVDFTPAYPFTVRLTATVYFD